jgi:tetratricopeptide (TPR) repeat protein
LAVTRFIAASLVLGTALLCTSDFASAQTSASVSRVEARHLAVALLTNNQPQAAKELSLALLKADAKDLDALFVLAKAERALGNHPATISAGKRAHAASGTKDEKYAAAMTVAEAHANNGSFTASQIWLRRAQQHAPTEGLKKQAIKDFKFVRANNPVSVDLRFSVRPSDNINNGTTSEGIYYTVLGQKLFFATPASAKPLAGTEITYGVTFKLRPRLGRTSPLSFSLDMDARDVRLNSDAKDINPDAKNDDFAFSQTTIGAEYKLLQSNETEVSMGLSFGRNWYASDHLTDISEMNFAVSHLISGSDLVGFTL